MHTALSYGSVRSPRDRQGDASHPPRTLPSLLPRQAGCPAARSPGFVLVGVNLHLVSHTEEPEISKILFQLVGKTKQNTNRKQQKMGRRKDFY